MVAVTTEVQNSTAEDIPEADGAPIRGVDRVLPWVLLIGGLIGAASSIMLTIEKFRTLENPAYVPSCNFNPLISCGSVMNTPQGSAFGFPNPIIGVFAFGVVVTVGVVLLVGATLPDWFWIGLLGGTVFGVAFIHWLFIESVWSIGALCPYCMAVWVVTITIFCYTALSIFADDHFGAPAVLRRPAQAISRVHVLFPVVWVLVIAALIIIHFWSVWPTLF